MKKTLSMLLALAMVVAVIAVPVSAKEVTGSVGYPTVFDVSEYDVGYLTNDLIAGNGTIAHVGVGDTMDVPVPGNDTTNYDISFATGGGTKATKLNKTQVTGGTVSENLNVSVAELDGEKVIALKGASNQPAGIVSAPIAEGQLADGGALTGSFKFMQPTQGWSNGVYLGLAYVEDDGSISYLEINEPTLTIDEWSPETGLTSFFYMRNKYNRASSAVAWLTIGGSDYHHTNKTGTALDGEVQRQVASPYNYYSMYSQTGVIAQSDAWGGGPYTATDKDGNDFANYMDAMGKWMQVDYELTAHAKGIQVDITSHEEGSPYAGVLSTSNGRLLRFVIPMTAEEIASYDGRLAVALTAEEGTTYVKDFGFGKVENISAEATEFVHMVDMESYTNGQTKIRDNNLYTGAAAADAVATGFSPESTVKVYAPHEAHDALLNNGNNVGVVYNPTKGQNLGNESNKVLAVYTNDSPLTYGYGWTGPYIPREDIINGNVRLSFDMYQAGATPGNTMWGLSLRHANGGHAGAMNATFQAYQSGLCYTGDYYLEQIVANGKGGNGVYSKVAGSPKNSWVRYNIDFSLNANDELVMSVSTEDLKSGAKTGPVDLTYARNSGDEGVKTAASRGLDYAFTFISNESTANMAYYFDNISVTTYEKTSEKVLISSDVVTTGVNSDATELYVKFGAPAASQEALVGALTLTDVDGGEVAYTVNSYAKDADDKYVLTLGLPDGIGYGVCTLGFGALTDIFGATIEDTNFYVADSTWEEYTETAYAYTIPENFKVGDTLDIALEDDGYDTSYFGLTSPNGAFSITDNGDYYTVTALKGGENTIYASDYRVSGIVDEALVIDVLNTNAIHTVTFVDGDSVVEIEVIDGESVTPPASVGGAEGQTFAGWTTDAGEFVLDSEFVHVEKSITYYAAYSDPLDITFTANEEEGTVTATCQATVGGVLITLPVVTPAPGYAFAGWVAADGETVYTQDQLATLIFNEETSFTAKFDYVAITLDEYYDFTMMSEEDFAAANMTIEANSTYTLDENGFYTPGAKGNWGAIHFNVPAANTGIYKFEVDFMTDAATEGEDNEINWGMNIHYLTEKHITGGIDASKVVQSTYINKSYSAQRKADANVGTFANAKMVRGQEQKLEVIFDFDNNKFYTIMDGVVAMVTDSTQELVRGGLKAITFDNQAGNAIKGIMFSKVDALDVYTVNTVANEYGAIALGGRTDVATYEVPADYAIDVAYVEGEVGKFGAWVVTDATVEGNLVYPTADGATIAATVKGLYAKAGDANLDNKITVADAIEVLKHSAGITTLVDDAFDNADVNADGVVNGTDATLILKYIARLILTF